MVTGAIHAVCDVTDARAFRPARFFELTLVAFVSVLLWIFVAAGIAVAFNPDALKPAAPPDPQSDWIIVAATILVLPMFFFYVRWRTSPLQWSQVQVAPYRLNLLELRRALRPLQRPWFRTPLFYLLLNLSFVAAPWVAIPIVFFLTGGVAIGPPLDSVLLTVFIISPIFVVNGIRLWMEKGAMARILGGFGLALGQAFVFGVVYLLVFGAGLLAVAGLAYAFGFESKDMARVSPWISTAILLAIGTLAYLLAVRAFRRFERLNLRARSLMQPTIRDAESRDPRRPLLYLRSFGDDETYLSSDSRFEDEIAQQVRPFGPFIAIAAPGQLRDSGAARDYQTEDTWRSVVLSHMSRAGAVIMLVGVTDSLKWELWNLFQHGYLRKVILLFPPSDDDHDLHCETLREMFASTPYGPALARADLSHAIGIHVEGNNSIVVIAGHRAGAGQYQAAMLTALYGVLMGHHASTDADLKS